MFLFFNLGGAKHVKMDVGAGPPLRETNPHRRQNDIILKELVCSWWSRHQENQEKQEKHENKSKNQEKNRWRQEMQEICLLLAIWEICLQLANQTPEKPGKAGKHTQNHEQNGLFCIFLNRGGFFIFRGADPLCKYKECKTYIFFLFPWWG